MLTGEVGALVRGDIQLAVVIAHPAAAGGADGLVDGGLGHGDHVEASHRGEGGDALGVEVGPVGDERSVIERAIGDGTLGLIHGDDHRTRGIGDTVNRNGLFGDEDLHVVPAQPGHHVVGGLEIALVRAVEGDDVALGIEVAVFTLAGVLGPEEPGLRALDVVLVAQPLADHVIRIGVRVRDTSLVDLHLAGQDGVLLARDVDALAQAAVLDGLHGVVVIGGQLDGEGDGALQHRELRRVGGGHIVPRLPVRLIRAVGGLVAGVVQIVSLRGDVAVVAVVVGHGGDAESLARAQQVLGQQVILEVRLVRRVARLHLEALDPAVELGEKGRVEGSDEVLHVLGLGGGLEGVVPVQVIAAGGMPGDIRSALDVLLRDEDEEHIVEQLVNGQADVLAGVVLVEVDHAGAPVARGQIAEIGGGVLDEVGDSGAARRAHGAHLGGKLRPALVGKAGELRVVELAVRGGALDQHPRKGHDAVGRGDLIGVDVRVHDGDLQVVVLAGRDVLECAGRVGLRLVAEGQPFGHGLRVLREDHVGHVERLVDRTGGGTHGELLDIEVRVVGGVGHHVVEILIDLLHGVEAVVGDNLHGRGAERRLAEFGSQVEIAAHVEVRAAVAVRGAGVAAPVADAAEAQAEVGRAVLLGERAALHGEQRSLLARLPGAQFAALGLVGILLLADVALRLILVHGPDDAREVIFRERRVRGQGELGEEVSVFGQCDDVRAAVGALEGGGGSGGRLALSDRGGGLARGRELVGDGLDNRLGVCGLIGPDGGDRRQQQAQAQNQRQNAGEHLMLGLV